MQVVTIPHTRLLVLGDTHIGNHSAFGGRLVNGINSRCTELLDSLAFNVASVRDAHKVTAVVQLGDFFDSARPSASVVEAARRMIANTGIEWYILGGNHEWTSEDTESAVTYLRHTPNVTVITDVTYAKMGPVGALFLPYTQHDFKSLLQKSMHAISVNAHRTSMVFGHYGITEHHFEHRTDTLRVSEYVKITSNGWPPKTSVFGHEHSTRFIKANNTGNMAISCGSYADIAFESDRSPFGTVLSYDAQSKNYIGRLVQLAVPRMIDCREFPDTSEHEFVQAVMAQAFARPEAAPHLRRALWLPPNPFPVWSLYLKIKKSCADYAARMKAAKLINDYTVVGDAVHIEVLREEIKTFGSDVDDSIAERILHFAESPEVFESAVEHYNETKGKKR